MMQLRSPFASQHRSQRKPTESTASILKEISSRIIDAHLSIHINELIRVEERTTKGKQSFLLDKVFGQTRFAIGWVSCKRYLKSTLDLCLFLGTCLLLDAFA
jgi:hypothetical protein